MVSDANNENTETENPSGSEDVVSDPNIHTPSLLERQFGKFQSNDATNDTSLGNTDVSTTTPLSLSIPTFENVYELPTPMIYSPNSPKFTFSPKASKDSTFRPLHIDKKRQLHHKNLEEVKDTARIVSELIPPPSISSKRIISLPSVNNEVPSLSLHTVKEEEEEEEEDAISQDETQLTGFLLNNLDTPIEYTKVRQIGTGNFSTVNLYQNMNTNEFVAIKKMKYPNDMISNTEKLSRLESSLTREIKVLQNLNHPCIISLFGINNEMFLNSTKPLSDLIRKYKPDNVKNLPACELIMSFCHGGDLLHAMTLVSGDLDLWLIQRIFTELAIAVKYLHENSIVHRDLKLENILLNYSIEEIIELHRNENINFNCFNLIKLGDFGLCKKLESSDELCTTRCGSEDYISPEILMGIPYDGHLSDTWALGVILYSLLEDRLPFDPPPNSNLRQRNRPISHRIARFEWRWFKFANSNSSAKDIVTNTLTRKNQRWDINSIYQSSFIKDISDTLEF
ncbi:hypothetical protein KAFR_0D03100 [Kazachstania africana CBS 2517]|uniref:Protein kinase domain-containing protein n=1 Tax=Kazachstania africana (strain ATCC 22294 / BCRC 22015 / CBS 2517 / CECT 1963 / NBRC 1671 / NRRL Y-8276) TaxID=1071382 RepID=H2AUA8_KAZAF|nr:hypothetical protein KAFR_0D03100 [Kazachstania africana CBS 2517]CCF57958.1 hypothetical protein KAFR_0D03100 [Kazachstania africana CBS 2517]